VIDWRRKLCLIAGISLCAVAFAMTLGCGSSSSKIRLANASPDEASLDLLVDSKTVASATKE
jgi:hypothetical protein